MLPLSRRHHTSVAIITLLFSHCGSFVETAAITARLKINTSNYLVLQALAVQNFLHL